MIRNDNKPGNYWVLVYARRNSIASFECPTIEDVHIEVNRIVRERDGRGLRTSRATARQLIEISKPRRPGQLGPVIEIPITFEAK